MAEFKSLTEKIKEFNKERNWEQFHDPKDLAIALNIETSELLELFLWKRNENVEDSKVAEELADIFIYALNLADKFSLSIPKIVQDKLAANAIKYPVNKSKASDKKYTDL